MECVLLKVTCLLFPAALGVDLVEEFEGGITGLVVPAAEYDREEFCFG